jgi:hypothetical protein
MTETTLKEDFLSKVPRSNEDFFSWSYFISCGLVALFNYLATNSLAGFSLRSLLLALIPATVIFLYWLFIRWVAITAEKSGRSFTAFMIFAILVPAIAWIIVIMFKKPQPIDPA